LVSESEEDTGIFSFNQAIERAEEAGKDLVEVAPNAKPAVCRIMDFGKYQYEESKKKKENRKKQHRTKVKEVQFHPRIEEHDYLTKFNHVVEFLKKGYKVKIVMFFRGREMAHQEIGKEVLNQVLHEITEGEHGKITSPPTRMGRRIIANVDPITQKNKDK